MASLQRFCFFNLAFLLVLISSFIRGDASAGRTKTVEFNVKPGGVVHSFTEGIVRSSVNSHLNVTELHNFVINH